MGDADGLPSLFSVQQDLPNDRLARARDNDVLVRVIEALQDSDVLNDGVSRVMDICRETPGADMIVLLRPNGDGEMETVAASDADFGLPRWEMSFGRIIGLGMVNDLGGASLQRGLPQQAKRFQSLLAVPVEDNPQSQLVLVALRGPAHAFGDGDLNLLGRIGKHLGHVLQCQRARDRVAAFETILDGDDATLPSETTLDPSFGALNLAFNRLEHWQSRILQVIDDLLSASAENVDVAINKALASLGQLSESDRTYVFRLRPPDRLDNTHEWVAPGIEPMIGALQDIDDDMMDEWLPSFGAGLPVYIANVEELPDSSRLRDVLRMQGIQSLLTVPMLRAGKITGFVGYDAVRERRRFLPVELRLLLSVANTVSAVMDRASAENAANKAATDLAAESSRLRATLAAVPDLLISVDVDGRFISYNYGSATKPWYTPEAFLGRLIEEVLPPEIANLARSTMRELDETGTSKGQQYSFSTPGGERWFSSSAGAVRNGTETKGYVFLIRDVTEQVEQERRIRRLSRIAELTSNLVIVTDQFGRIDWVNPAFEKRSGWSLDEARGQKPGDFLQFERTDSSAVVDIRKRLDLGEPVRTECLNRSRSGEEYWVVKDIQPLHDANGRLEGFVSIQTDITAMKTSYDHEQQLRNTAIETASDAISISGFDGFFLYMNPAHREMFGIPPDEDIRHLTHDDLMATELNADFRDTSLPTMIERRRWHGQIIGRHRDGRDLELDITTTMINDNVMVSVAHDVTASKRAEAERARLREELQLAQRRETVAHIASGVAHDLSNLVAVVSGTVSILANTPSDEASVKNGLLRIGRAMEAARDLVHGLGDMVRPYAPRVSVDLRAAIVEAVDLLGTERVRRNGVHSELPPTPQLVMANRTELLQVIINLALNACEAAGDRPNTVILKVLSDDAPIPDATPDVGAVNRATRYRMFSVSDSGTGISRDLRSKLFDRYVTTKGVRGTGLGLPIVATIVQQSGGALWVDSTPGVGTTMSVAWAVDEIGVDRAARVEDDGLGPVDLDGMRILVVDDNIDIADSLPSSLSRMVRLQLHCLTPTKHGLSSRTILSSGLLL